MEENSEKQTLEEYLAGNQDKWAAIINDLSASMRRIDDLPQLMNNIYVKRQEAVEYYHSLMAKFAVISREYKNQYASVYNNIKQTSNIRYTTEAAVNAQVDAILKDEKYKIDVIDNHLKYMMATIKNITDMIYGINTRVEIEKLSNSVKL